MGLIKVLSCGSDVASRVTDSTWLDGIFETHDSNRKNRAE